MTVGSGSSGAVVANRLSEDPSVSVLVVEAGESGEWSLPITIPMFHWNLYKSKYDWKFHTVPQKHACKGMRDQKSYWPRGRALGGSSCMNGMVYVRGSRHDYDDWAANGCEGWSYKDVLPYFIKSENIQIPDIKDSDYHGTDGPLYVSPGNASLLADLYGDAMQELGYKVVDSNGEDMIGYLSISGLEGNVFMKTKKNSSYDYPDTQLHIATVCGTKDDIDPAITRVNLKSEVLLIAWVFITESIA
ncbi:hypothetical protein FSP39_003083 [Pinctada imbricata]|uniref:Glucose-methanol-choline oxidoreductase N-terminal domain-containing protein n=1 Tax=Pinctada imbricata TaxID=66713 RepID=A0AA88YH43_PINIB|nr:hypothetical protein FSP39_003083 [Pinctada imbricata]